MLSSDCRNILIFSLFFLALFEMNAQMELKLLLWHTTTKLKLKQLEWKLNITETEFIAETEISLVNSQLIYGALEAVYYLLLVYYYNYYANFKHTICHPHIKGKVHEMMMLTIRSHIQNVKPIQVHS